MRGKKHIGVGHQVGGTIRGPFRTDLVAVVDHVQGLHAVHEVRTKGGQGAREPGLDVAVMHGAHPMPQVIEVLSPNG